MKSNCIIFALRLWWRSWKRGRRRQRADRMGAETYICWRLSRVPWGMFHVLHGKLDRSTNQIKVVSYKPDRPEKAGVELLFKGRVVRGDKPNQ